LQHLDGFLFEEGKECGFVAEGATSGFVDEEGDTQAAVDSVLRHPAFIFLA
jgi:hypothetical protein